MKKKLYRIGNSKGPTLDQLKRMTFNLRKVYNVYATVKVGAWAHSVGGDEVEYWIGVGNDVFSGELKSWPETLATYRRLMKEAPNGS